MASILDTLTTGAASLWNQGVNATVAQITDMQSRALQLRRLAADMLTKRQQLQASLPRIAAKNPAVADAVRAHIQRGIDLQAMAQSALQKVDSVLASMRSGTASAVINGLAAAPVVAAAIPYVVLAGVLAALGTVTYAISSYNKRTDYLQGQIAALQGAGATSAQLQQVLTAANASAGDGVASLPAARMPSKTGLLLIGVAVGMGLYLWRRQ